MMRKRHSKQSSLECVSIAVSVKGDSQKTNFFTRVFVENCTAVFERSPPFTGNSGERVRLSDLSLQRPSTDWVCQKLEADFVSTVQSGTSHLELKSSVQ